MSLILRYCIIAADDFNCQKETAKIVVKGNSNYLLCVKDNQASLKKNIEDYVQEESLRKEKDTISKIMFDCLLYCSSLLKVIYEN